MKRKWADLRRKLQIEKPHEKMKIHGILRSQILAGNAVHVPGLYLENEMAFSREENVDLKEEGAIQE